jgi:hypothetical protein
MTLSADQQDLAVAADFNVVSHNNDLQLLALRDASGNVRAAVTRQKTTGKLKIQQGGSTVTTGTVLPLSSWTRVALHAVGGGGGACTVELYLDGNRVYRNTTATLNATAFRSFTIGPTNNVVFDFAADEVSATL